MTVDYAAIAGDAGAGIAEAGMPALILRKGIITGGSEHSPTRALDDAHACTVIQISLSKLIRNGSLVEGATAAYMLSTVGLAIEPGTKDRFRVGGVDYAILKVDPFAPGGVTVYYTLQVKR